jgi:FlaA1/EpsC-like NDP-sugar epimerase
MGVVMRDFLRPFILGKDIKRTFFHIMFDVLALFCSFVMAIVLYGKTNSIGSFDGLLVVGVSVLAAIYVLVLCKFYKIIVKYITGRAVIPASVSMLVSSLIAYFLSAFLDSGIMFAEIFAYALFGFMSILGFRYVYRDFIIRKSVKDEIRVIIYGAGEAGRQFLNSLNSASKYSAIAFVDDEQELQGHSVGGVKVFDPKSMMWLVKQFNVDVIALVIPSISPLRRREILNDLENLDAEIRVVPGLVDLMSKSVETSDAKPISIYDILGRVPVPPVQELISRPVSGKVVMVTGAGGSIGSEICRQIIRNQPLVLILFDLSEYSLYRIDQELNQYCSETKSKINIIPILGSVMDRVKVLSILKQFKVHTLFHAAAYKHVPLVEQNIVEGVKNNVFGTRAVVEASIEAGVRIVTVISTDKAVRPTNIMGASKRMAEFVCSSLVGNHQTKISMVRFGNVLGSSGSVVPLFEKQILRGEPVTVTHPEITRYFMTAEEAAQLVMQTSSMALGGEVYLLDMGNPVKIVDLAISMIKLHGKSPFIVDISNTGCPIGHVPIIFTGLRQGEKLYEELLVNNDAKKTNHPLIMSAVEAGPDRVKIAKYLKLLEKACSDNNVEDIKEILTICGTGLNHNGSIIDYSLKGKI